MAPGSRHRRLGASLGIVLIVLVGAGCASASGPAATSSTAAGPGPTQAALPALPPPAPIVWTACPGSSTLQCGTVSVPVDYRTPGRPATHGGGQPGPALDASDPGGMLLFNPGGPGESGNQILPVILGLLPSAVRQRFDVVSFDPPRDGRQRSPHVRHRAVGADQRAPGPRRRRGRHCREPRRSPPWPGPVRPRPLEPFINTVDTARDMDRIRQALGVPTISFYGMSYGTALGAVYADLFPHRVATMVLDGAVDVNASLTQQAVQEAPAAEQSLHHLFATCLAAGPVPAGHRSPGLLLRPGHVADATIRCRRPAPGTATRSPLATWTRPPCSRSSVTRVHRLYYSALIAAKGGNGAPLRDLALEFATDINGAPLVDPLWAITCNDAAAHPGPVAAGTLARTLDARYPLVGGYAVTYTMGGCVAWPAARQPVTDLHPTGTPPILVLGNTGDPNTPIVGARHLAAIFPSATMVTWKGWGHTWLLSGSGDACMQQVVSQYLDGAGLPAHGTVCS